MCVSLVVELSAVTLVLTAFTYLQSQQQLRPLTYHYSHISNFEAALRLKTFSNFRLKGHEGRKVSQRIFFASNWQTVRYPYTAAIDVSRGAVW